VFGAIFILAVVGSITRFFQEFLSDACAIRAVNDIRRKLYDRVLHLPVSYFVKHGTGDVTARLVTEAQTLQDGFKTVLGKAIQEPITAAFALSVAMLIDWRLTLFVIAFTPLMVMVIRKLGTKVRRAMRAALEKNARMLGQIEGTLAGIRVVKSAAAEPHERRRYARIMRGLLSDQIRMARYEAWSTPLLELLGLVAIGCVLTVASYLVFVDRSLEPSQLITIMICLVAIAEPLRRISKLNNVIQRSNAAASRIFSVLNEPAEGCIDETTLERRARSISGIESDVSESSDSTWIPRPTSSAISFDQVVFTYPGSIQPALDGITLEIPRGSSVAFVGRNGSGKTTLLSMLPRLFEPSSGSIRIDGIDIRDWPLRRLRRSIAVVTQEAILFPGTIAENIAYASPGVSRERVIDAAKRAYAHEFIEQTPLGYDTPLDGLGGRLSGGQRQRLNIARAILRDAPILILDEATSQVDAESEHLIQRAIEGLMRERTTLVIAHRLGTILNADKIVVMEAGQIVGTGGHDSLLIECTTYQKLYERQLFAA
jgi:ABC-type multidrug transport system fused ATPase/permease subunit